VSRAHSCFQIRLSYWPAHEVYSLLTCLLFYFFPISFTPRYDFVQNSTFMTESSAANYMCTVACPSITLSKNTCTKKFAQLNLFQSTTLQGKEIRKKDRNYLCDENEVSQLCLCIQFEVFFCCFLISCTVGNYGASNLSCPISSSGASNNAASLRLECLQLQLQPKQQRWSILLLLALRSPLMCEMLLQLHVYCRASSAEETKDAKAPPNQGGQQDKHRSCSLCCCCCCFWNCRYCSSCGYL